MQLVSEKLSNLSPNWIILTSRDIATKHGDMEISAMAKWP